MDTSYYNRFGAEELTRRLSSETLLAQGPMGSVLLSEYDAADIPPAFWNLAEPQTVSRIHRLYVAAGAQVLITNTFQASSYALKHDQIAPSVAEVNRGAVDDARQAHPQLLLGSMGPICIEWFAEDSAEYREIRGIAREQAHALLNAGVDGLLIETVTSIRNLQPMLAGARDAADGMPVLVSFVVDDKGDLLGDGLNIEAAVLYAEKHGANSVGVNCCSLAAANAAVSRMVASATTPVTVRPNAGNPVQTQDGPVWHEDPEAFARACVEWKRAGAAMVGSCCGTTRLRQPLWQMRSIYRTRKWEYRITAPAGAVFCWRCAPRRFCLNGERACRRLAGCPLRVYLMRTMIQTLRGVCACAR